MADITLIFLLATSDLSYIVAITHFSANVCLTEKHDASAACVRELLVLVGNWALMCVCVRVSDKRRSWSD